MSIQDESKSKYVSIEDHIELYNNLLRFLDHEIDEKSKRREPGVRTLQNVRKQVKTLKKQVPKLKKTVPQTKNRVSGFKLKCKIDKELKDFLEVDDDAALTRNDIRNGINVYIHFDPNDPRPQIQRWAHLNPGGSRNLQNPEKKSIIHPDTKLAKLLHYSEYVSRVKNGEEATRRKNKETGKMEERVVEDPVLTYCVVQKLYQHHILETVRE